MPRPRTCVYTVNRRPCGRPGSGNPCLCPAHLADLAEEEDLDELDEYETGSPVLDQLLSHPATQGLFGRIGALIDKAGIALEHGINNVGRGQPRASAPQEPPPGMTPREARIVLGFPPDLKLTPELIKTRKRELAKIFHTDKHGSNESMVRTNMAADLLLSSFKRKPTPS